MQNQKVWGSIFHGDSKFFSLSHTHDKTKKNNFLYFFMEFKKLKTYSLLFYL